MKESISEILNDFVDQIEKKFENPEQKNILTGFTNLDNFLLGLKPAELITIGARPGMGKTNFLLNVLEYAVLKHNDSSLFFSLEQSITQIIERILSSFCEINLRDMQSANLYGEDWLKLSTAIGLFSEKKLHIVQGPFHMQDIVKKIHSHMTLFPLTKLICIDNINLIQCDKRDNLNEEIQDVCKSLKNMAIELNITVMVTSPLNRAVETRQDKRPCLSDLRGSGAIEDMSDMVWFIYRDEVYYRDCLEKNTAEIIVAKNRNGLIGTIRLIFLGWCCRFANYLNPTKAT